MSFIAPSVRISPLEDNADTLKIKKPKYCPAKSFASSFIILKAIYLKGSKWTLYVFLSLISSQNIIQLAPIRFIRLTSVECQLTAHACPTYIWRYISESLDRCSWQLKPNINRSYMSRLSIVMVMSVINYNLQVFRSLMKLNPYNPMGSSHRQPY